MEHRIEITRDGGEVTHECEISKDAKIIKPARVQDNVEVWGYSIVEGKSLVRDWAKLFDMARVTDSLVRDHARIYGQASAFLSEIIGFCEMSGWSFASRSVIRDHALIVGRGHVVDSIVSGTARVIDAMVFNAWISGNACITGLGTIVKGISPYSLSIKGSTHIHEGTWTRAPLLIEHPYFNAQECVPGRMLIGCQCRPIKLWKKKGEYLANKLGLTASAYQDYMKAIAEIEERQKF